MKNNIISRSNQFKLSNNPETKKLGKIIVKYINNFNCYYCLDTVKCWRSRNHGFWDSIDGRGSYDIMRCNNCSNGGWISCSKKNDLLVNNIKVFKKNNNNVEDRINELRKIYKNKLSQPDEEWKLYEKKEIFKKTTELELNINVKKLADIVYNSIKIYAGDLISIASLAKDLTINISNSFTKENDSTEIIRKERNNSNEDVYILFKVNKQIKQRSAMGNFFKKKKFTFLVKYILLIPINNVARDRCNQIMNENIDNKIDDFIF